MKKLLSLLLLLSSLVLTSCSDKAEPPILKEDEFLYEENMNLEIHTRSVFNRIAPSGDGIYYVTGEYLYFYDYASGQSVLLCNKPNCKHNKETDQMIGQECNAYTQNASYGGTLDQSFIMYHNGYIYMKQDSVNLQTGGFTGYDIVRIEKDGSNREILYHVSSPYALDSIALHDGKIYFETYHESSSETNKLNVLDLNDLSAEPEIILKDNIKSISDFFLKDNYLYLSAQTYIDDDGNAHNYIFGRYDLDNKQFELIKEGCDPMNLSFSIIDDGIYAYGKDHDTYIYNSNTGEDIRLCDESGHVAVGKDLIFVHNGFGKLNFEEGTKSVSVFDKDLNFIDIYELEEGSLYCDSGVINNELYYFNMNDDVSVERICRLYLNEDNKLESAIFSEVYPTENKMGGYVTYEIE